MTWMFFRAAFFNPIAVLAIAVAVLSFSLGASFGMVRPNRQVPGFCIQHSSGLKLVVFGGLIANGVGAVLTLQAFGFGLSSALSFGTLVDIAHAISVARYDGVERNKVVSILLGLGYASAITMPFLSPSLRHPRIMLTLPVLSILPYVVITTERLPLLITTALTAGGAIGATVHRRGQMPNPTRRGALAVIVVLTLIGGLFTLIAFMRAGSFETSYADRVFAKLEVYAFGSVPAFSEWYEAYVSSRHEEPLGLGTASVAGVEFITGQDRRDTRAYEEYEVVSSNYASTNIYTVFRGLILDFGEAGALLVLVLLGYALARIYLAACQGGITHAVGLSAGYSMILLSNTMSIVTFTNVLGGILIAMASLRLAARPVAVVRTIDKRRNYGALSTPAGFPEST